MQPILRGPFWVFSQTDVGTNALMKRITNFIEMKKKYFCLTFLILCFSTISFAQTQLEMNRTADVKFKKADAELNKIYNQLMKMLDKNEKQLLITAEKDWLKFRDSHCKFEDSQYEGGSIQPLIYSSCLEELTRKRIAEIKASIKDHNL